MDDTNVVEFDPNDAGLVTEDAPNTAAPPDAGEAGATPNGGEAEPPLITAPFIIRNGGEVDSAPNAGEAASAPKAGDALGTGAATLSSHRKPRHPAA